MQQLSLKWSAVIAISAALVQVAIFNDLGLFVRPALVLWFLMVCPGMAFVQLLRFEDKVFELVLAVVLSLAIDLLVATAVLYAGFWSPELILIILIVLSLVGVECQLIIWYSNRAKGNVEQA